jgi:diguanylate cyclase (GGDEF)-like protein
MASWSTQQLVEFLAGLSACTDERSAVLNAVERVAEALDAEVAALIKIDRCVASTGFAVGEVPVDDLTAIARGEARTITVPSVGACNAMIVALDDPDSGWLVVARAQGEPFDHEDASVFRGMARVLTLTVRQLRLIESERILRERSQREVDERRAIEQALAHQALHDALTGLPNRKLLLDRLDHGLAVGRRQGTLVAVLFVDIDNFKLINDTLGHQVGDELLRLVSQRLRDSMRLSDTVARLGGDEFVIVGEAVLDQEDAVGVASRAASCFAEPFNLVAEQLVVTASVGVATSDARSNPQSLIRDADAAMYHAKARGRGRVELFDDAMRGRLVERMGREKELRRALEREELVLFYQPIFALAEHSAVAAEALIRWRHPVKGLLPACDFIPLAEESGLIVQLDEWVVANACKQLAVWQAADLAHPGFTLSLNISARQLEDGRFAEQLAAAVDACGVDPQALGLEITETVLIENSDSPIAILEALRSLGPRLILDDFGTGYSSLSYLQRLPLDVLKLDQSFVTGLALPGRDRDIVSALIHLATVLDLDVVAEGIETAAQLGCLKDLGCQFGQGYHLGRPMPASDFEDLLIARPTPQHAANDSSGPLTLAVPGLRRSRSVGAASAAHVRSAAA